MQYIPNTPQILIRACFPGNIHFIFSFGFIRNVVAFKSNTKFRFSTGYDPAHSRLSVCRNGTKEHMGLKKKMKELGPLPQSSLDVFLCLPDSLVPTK